MDALAYNLAGWSARTVFFGISIPVGVLMIVVALVLAFSWKMFSADWPFTTPKKKRNTVGLLFYGGLTMVVIPLVAMSIDVIIQGEKMEDALGIVSSDFSLGHLIPVGEKTVTAGPTMVRNQDGTLSAYEAVNFIYKDGTLTMSPVSGTATS